MSAKCCGSLAICGFTMQLIDIEAVTGIEKRNKDGSAIETHRGSLLVDLPTYHWTYGKPAMAESRASQEHRGMKEATSRHPRPPDYRKLYPGASVEECLAPKRFAMAGPA